MLIIGDGSGSGWDIGAGWAGAIIDRVTNKRKLIWGAWSTGSVMIAEIMPYLHGLLWFENLHGSNRRLLKARAGKPPILEIHVICDNETIVRQGNNAVDRKKMRPWWLAWDTVLRSGYSARFHFTPRMKIGLNALCDHLSRGARLAIQDLTLVDKALAKSGGPESVYDVNHS